MRKIEKPDMGVILTHLVSRILNDAAVSVKCQCSLSFARDIKTIRKRASHEGVSFFSKTLPSLGKALDRALAGDKAFVAPAGLAVKPNENTAFPILFGELWPLIFNSDGLALDHTGLDALSVAERLTNRHGNNSITHALMEAHLVSYDEPTRSEELVTGCSVVIKYIQTWAVRTIRQVCFLAYKLEGQHTEESERLLFDGFIQTDAELPEHGQGVKNPLCREWSPFIREMFPGDTWDDAFNNARIAIFWATEHIDAESILPKHGPGAVATGEKAWKKMHFKRLYAKLEKEYPFADYFFFNANHLAYSLESLEALDELPVACAKATCVPKDSRGPRLISMEPLELQWIQQGLANAIRAELERPGNVAYGKINFTSQDVNRRLALESSVTETLWDEGMRPVTIDLKDASDRVSVRLVEELIGGHLFRKLMACRSDKTELPDGRVVELNKFAPMGSACCFPIEALVFWALCVGAMIHKNWPYTTPLSKSRVSEAPVYVYGDDLVVPFKYLGVVTAMLESVSLKLSPDKCCTGRFFRESCGVDAYKGFEVTPVRVKHSWQYRPSPNTLLSWVTYANALGLKGYSTARDYLEELIQEQVGLLPVSARWDFPLAFYREGLNLLECESMNVERGFKVRENRKYQLREIRIRVPRAREIYHAPTDHWTAMLEHNQAGRKSAPGIIPPSRVGIYTVPRRVTTGWSWTKIESLIL